MIYIMGELRKPLFYNGKRMKTLLKLVEIASLRYSELINKNKDILS